ncbi:low-density lipoprotein receptor-related protein 4-like [Lytechinus variegatus]|uniref:low-density lipoprotein receptor-related protein 4-like n=1 Tax=Lytechinus variegatus TaxID=7654 RepID=UPI001BB15D08|nr:low-density lipoprotein receptor-related protein 4-like [Lytechinus variegatus]XP_041463969.1 low-density lipoprotein receptor-related protein 4-like [Lytechinus variegatus]
MTFTFLPVNPASEPWDITYDHTDDRVYWTETGDDLIYSANVDGTGKQSITGFYYNAPVDIAIAETARRIYCAFRDESEIRSILLDGTEEIAEVTSNIDKPRALVVFESTGHLYWSHTRKIERINLDQSGRTMLFENEAYDKIVGLDVSLSDNRIYFADEGDKHLVYTDLDGNNMQVVQGVSDNYIPQDMMLHNGMIYFTDKSIKGIVICDDFTESSPTFHEYPDETVFSSPRKMHITTVPS